jgi:hypothetical protein
MSFAEARALTVPQLNYLMGHRAHDPATAGPALTDDDLAARQDAAWRQVCQRFNLSPCQLAELSAADLAAKLGEVFPAGTPDVASLPAAARAFRDRTPHHGGTATTVRWAV